MPPISRVLSKLALSYERKHFGGDFGNDTLVDRAPDSYLRSLYMECSASTVLGESLGLFGLLRPSWCATRGLSADEIAALFTAWNSRN